jgi:hypothetical protein
MQDVMPAAADAIRERPLAAPSSPAFVDRGDVDLGAVLAHRRWRRHLQPFPHFTAEDVFVPALHAALVERFRDILARGLQEGEDKRRFSRRMNGYDAYTVEPDLAADSPFAVFASRAWCRLLAEVCRVAVTPDVQVALHHHLPDSTSGWIHTDLSPGWFVDRMPENGVNLADPACHYKTGRTKDPSLRVRRTVRAVALIYFVANPDWQPAHGGETGLYRAQRDPVASPAARVPPRDNSFVLFECTPFSFHSFLTNRQPRNSLVMWLHRPHDEVVTRWGEKSIAPWRTKR